jgi:hypothetical protein
MPETGYTTTVLNTIRNSASTGYQDRIPSATRSNITSVGNAILTYTPDYNEFTSLLGKIALSIVSSKMAMNPLAKFKKGLMPVGTTIEDIFVKMASANNFDETGANPLGRRLPDITAMYHRENRQDEYSVSISRVQVKGAFNTPNGIQNLLDEIVNSLYSGDNYDEFILMKELLADYEDNFFDYQVPAMTSEANTKEFIKTVRKAVNDCSFTNTLFNKAGVKTHCERQDLVLLVNKDVVSEVDVEVLAKAFNMGKTDFEPEVVVVDDFGTMTDTYGVLVDRNFFMVYDTVYETAEQFNAQGLFTNIFLHHHQILSLSQFKNAIRFTTALATGTDILTFVLDEQTGAATINATAHTVAIEVESGTTVTALEPTITLSHGATVDPESGEATDFTSPVVYTVTAEDETTEQEWTVTVTVAS